MWCDAGKSAKSNIILKFDKKCVLREVIAPSGRITTWDGHPCNKLESDSITSGFSRPAGFEEGYHCNPYLNNLEFLHVGSDGDSTVKRILEKRHAELRPGDEMFTLEQTYERNKVKLSFKLKYVHKSNNLSADWKATHKVLGTPSATANTSIYHICKVDLTKETIEDGRYTQPTLIMAEKCVKDKDGNWLGFANDIEEVWGDEKAIKARYGTEFLCPTIYPIRMALTNFIKEKVDAWTTEKLKNNILIEEKAVAAFAKETSDSYESCLFFSVYLFFVLILHLHFFYLFFVLI